MAGEAKTNAFMLASATVMVGPTDKLFDLNPDEHSIGLVKNFQVTADPTYTELTQGVKNTIVYSVMTNNPVKATMEVYEFTSQNLAYGLGLDGSTLDAIATDYVTTADVVGDGTTTDAFTISSSTDISSDFAAGTYVAVQEVGGTDNVFVGTVNTATYASQVLTVTLNQKVPEGVTLHAGSMISKMNRINVGSKDEQPFLAAKVVGILPDNNEPIVVLFPKVRITKGFTVAFHTDQFQNLPYEFTPYDLVSTDDNYSMFAGTGPVAILGRS